MPVERLGDWRSKVSGAAKLAAEIPIESGPEQLVGFDRNAVGCTPLGCGPLQGALQVFASIGSIRWASWIGSEGTPQVVVSALMSPGDTPELSTVAVIPGSPGRRRKSTTNGQMKPMKPKGATTSPPVGAWRL